MSTILLKSNLIRRWLPRRPDDAHKGHFGHTLVIAGSQGMAGAGVLAAWGALRGGSGLVTLATVRSRQDAAALALIKSRRPEAMTLGLPETFTGSLSVKALPILLRFIAQRRITSLVIGPGLSRSNETARLVRRLLQRLERDPLNLRGIVLDADGFLAAGNQILRARKLPVIVTPHPGELARFAGARVEAGGAARLKAAEKFATLYRVVCVLKGSGTVVSDGRNSYVNTTGNPGMAKGGSGDVLAGLLGALIGQFGTSLYLLRAACVGIFVHGLAGDLAAAQKSRMSMLPGDLAEQIPAAIKKISR